MHTPVLADTPEAAPCAAPRRATHRPLAWFGVTAPFHGLMPPDTAEAGVPDDEAVAGGVFAALVTMPTARLAGVIARSFSGKPAGV